MPTAPTTKCGIDSAASTVPMRRLDATLQLSARTVAWLANRPRDRKLVDSVWDKLVALDEAGHHPGAIAALRFVLVHHQPPTSTGRCHACRRWTVRRIWRRPPWPCVVWKQIHHELLGPFIGSTHHRRRL